jgi:hypothetical protein
VREQDKLLRDTVDLKHSLPSLKVRVQDIGAGIGGATLYGRKSRKAEAIQVPRGDTCLERTIRLHETIHAQRQKPPGKEQQSMPGQAIGDVMVHTVDWPKRLPLSVTRDALAAACLDARKAKTFTELAKVDDEKWNAGCYALLRAMAICHGAGPTTRAAKRVRECAKAFGGELLLDALTAIIETATERKGRRKDKEQTAREAFARLLRHGEGDEEGDEEGEDKADKDKPGTKDGKRRPGMRIVNLPLSQECDPSARRLALARSGAHLNPHRLPSALANGTTAGLFRRTRREAGGAVLLDASGSMHVSTTRLRELCRLAPGATVAYYSASNNVNGVLVIFAKDGRRYNADGALPEHHEGNTVDYPALRWLLRQPGPRWIVTDREFCGGAPGEKEAALLLLQANERRGEVSVIESVDEALNTFRAMKVR